MAEAGIPVNIHNSVKSRKTHVALADDQRIDFNGLGIFVIEAENKA